MRIVDNKKLYSIKEASIIFTVNPNQIRKIIQDNNIETTKKRINGCNYTSIYNYLDEERLNQIGKLLVRYCTICNKPLINQHGGRKYCHECRIKLPNHGLPQKKYIATEEFTKRWDALTDSILSNTKTAKRVTRLTK